MWRYLYFLKQGRTEEAIDVITESTPLQAPPYYAIKMGVDYLDTIGGIRINERMEVLDKKDIPIPGIYAAGIDTGGWVGDTYCIRTTGTTFGFAINSGRIAGESAVKKMYEEKE